MREFKFRIWDKIENTYCHIGHNAFVLESNGGFYCSGYCMDNFIIQQYTGLHDKNGREIFEGDICSGDFKNNSGLSGHEIGEVIWRYGGFTIMDMWIMRFDNLTILGNIFENPESLEEK